MSVIDAETFGLNVDFFLCYAECCYAEFCVINVVALLLRALLLANYSSNLQP